MDEFEFESLRFEKHVDAVEHFYDVKNDALQPGQTNAIIMTCEGKVKSQISNKKELLENLLERVNVREEEMKLISEAAAQIPSLPEHPINVEETKGTTSVKHSEEYKNRLAELKREFLPAGIYVYTCNHCGEVG